MKSPHAALAVATGFGLGKQAVVAIDPDRSCFQGPCDTASAGVVGRVNAGRKTVASGVGRDDRGFL